MTPLDDIHKIADRIEGGASRIATAAGHVGPIGSHRFGSRAAWSAAITLTLFFAARAALELDGLSRVLRIAIALVPLPAFVWFLWEFVRRVRDSDELERRVQLEALAVAFPLTLILVMMLGLMQIAVPLPPEDWSYRHIWPLLYVFYVVGILRARRRYE